MRPFFLCLLSLLTPSFSKCAVRKDADIIVYAAIGAGGVGDNSIAWTRAFFSWLVSANPSLVVDYAEDPSQFSGYPSDASGCKLTSFASLKLWVQPGGSADNMTTSLGPGGRDNLLDFAASAQGHFMGTCAGYYYAAGSWWWFDDFYPMAWAPHWWPTVEGPLSPIAVYPDYAPVQLSDGRTVLYWGGPVLGLNKTAAAIPNGATELVKYASPLLAAPLGAAYRYEGTYIKALFSSAHPEAVAGSGIACSPPLPAGCITPAQQLSNWRWLGAEINALLGTSFVIPTSLHAQ
jgi:hypothetical protein